MKVVENVLKRLNEMDLSSEQRQKIEKIFDEELKNYIPVEYLKKNCINIVDVYTGMLPRPKAEEHIKKMTKSEVIKSLKEEGYKIIYMGKPYDSTGTKVNRLEKNKLNVIEVCVGLLPKPKAEQYLRQMNDRVKELRLDGYKLLITGYRNENEALRIKKDEDSS